MVLSLGLPCGVEFSDRLFWLPELSPRSSPSPCFSNQSSQFAGAQFLIVSLPTGQAALAWLSGFCFFGPGQESTWGGFLGTRGPVLPM